MQNCTPELPVAAVVIGLCVHGLAVCRALSTSGIRVHALESDETIPGIHTNCARVHMVNDLTGNRLVENLLANHSSIAKPNERPILFPANDNMVKTINDNWERLRDLYRISWSEDREAIRTLLDKSHLAEYCSRAGLNYPVSMVVSAADDIKTLKNISGNFFIVKPASPLSSFKVRKVSSLKEIEELIARHADALPFIVQPWIDGPDTNIFFGAVYYSEGKPLRSYTGQKLMSHPPALGQTTAAVSSNRQDILELTHKFFSGFKLSGPVSLELKMDAEGNFWVIEPTIGRSDFWVGCCVQNGVNLPAIEYLHQVGHEIPEYKQTNRRVWVDSAKDPLISIKLLKLGHLKYTAWKLPMFSYFDIYDLKPSLVSLRALVKRKVLGLFS